MNGYLWKKEWCWPYESAWSIIEKFKYANAISNDSLPEIISLRTTTSTMIFTEKLYTYRQAKFSEDDFLEYFQISPTHFDTLNVFKGNDFNQLFRKDLYYCPTCIRFGYHSFLHQLTFVDLCPFHQEPLLRASYDGNTIPYSIHTKRNEAYSTMIDQAKIPAKRYVDVMESRKLIDGIWESIPPIFSLIKLTNCRNIRFFNPCVNSSQRTNEAKDRLHKSLKRLFFESHHSIKSIASFSNEECKTLYDKLIHRIKDKCQSLCLDFNRETLDEWLIQLTVEDLSSTIQPELLKEVISKINFLEQPNNIEVSLFHKIAAKIITAYIITDSTYLLAAFDYSIIIHFYNHSSRNSLFSFQSMLNKKDFIRYHPYINYYIFHVLTMKLYKYKLKEIEENNQLIYQKDNPVLMNIPWYIIVSNDQYFDIYEVD